MYFRIVFFFDGKSRTFHSVFSVYITGKTGLENKLIFFICPLVSQARKETRRLEKYLIVLAGAGLGGLVRYVAGSWIMAKYVGAFPWGTFLINISGSFLIGILMTLLTERAHPHPNLRLFLVVGVLGGYTTFSSFEYETLVAVREGERWLALMYAGGSVVAGFAAVWLGAILGSGIAKIDQSFGG